MASIDHFKDGQRLLAESQCQDDPAWAKAFAIQSLAAATLALAAVTALSSTALPVHDYNAWFDAASVDAPIPPETDAEGGD